MADCKIINTILRIISLILSGALLLSNPAFASAGYNIKCALATQSAFKPLVSVMKTETGFAIIDDEALLREAEKGFRKDAEILYLNFLKEQAEAVGLSRDGIRRLIREHLEEVDFTQSSKEVAGVSQEGLRRPHTYVEVKGEDKDKVLSEISHTMYLNIKSYYERLLKGYRSTSKRSAELDLKDISEVEAKDLPYNLDEAAIFPHGLLRDEDDEDGVLWIVKKRDEKGYKSLGAKWRNLPRREKLAYLVSENRSNSAEIRLLSNEDIKNSPGLENVIDDVDAYYLVRVVTGQNVDKEQLPHQDLSQAYSSIFIASILIRKHDHHPWNCAYTGDIPVSLDNDIALGLDIAVNPRDESNFRRFMCPFLYHALFLAARVFLRASVDEESVELPNNQYEEFIKNMKELMFSEEWSTKFDQILHEMSLTIKKFGLADSFISAEMLNEDHMRKSILEFKSIENARELAIEAGYTGEELDFVATFIIENQRTLGRDVNEMLKFITGKDYGFDKIDEEYKIQTGLEREQTFIKPEPIPGMDLWQERDIIDIDGNIVDIAEALEEMAKDIELGEPVMRNTKFSPDMGAHLERKGYHVVYEKDYCLVTSPGELEKYRAAESKWGQTFIDDLLWRAREARKKDQKVIVGLDTSWIPEEQLPCIQGMLSKLNRLSGEKGLENIIIIRGKGEGLGSELSNKATETKTPLANVVVLGDHKVLESESFDPLRPGADPENWAFFAGVELPEDFPTHGYIRLLEMLTISLNLAFGKSVALDNPFIQIYQEGKRMFRLIPRVEPFDYELLQEIYKGQLKAMESA